MRSASCACLCGVLVACSSAGSHNAGSSQAGSGGGAGTTSPAADPGPAAGAAVSALFNGARLDFTKAALAVYSSSEQDTFVSANTPDDKSRMAIRWRGASAGAFTCGDGPDAGIGTSLSYSWSQSTAYNASYTSTSSATITPCTVTVTAMGAVGEPIRGTFSGTVVATDRSAPTKAMEPPQRGEITSGVFDVMRGPDIP